jgi:hypothetical protein
MVVGFDQGCQMVYFRTKNTNLGIFWSDWKRKYWYFLYFTVIWYILWPLGSICSHLVDFSHFGIFTKKNLATLCRTRSNRTCYQIDSETRQENNAGLPDFHQCNMPKRENIQNNQQIYQMAIQNTKSP